RGRWRPGSGATRAVPTGRFVVDDRRWATNALRGALRAARPVGRRVLGSVARPGRLRLSGAAPLLALVSAGVGATALVGQIVSALEVLAGRAAWALAQGDVLARLAELPDASV